MKKKYLYQIIIFAVLTSCASRPTKTNPDPRKAPSASASTSTSTSKAAPVLPAPSIEAKQLANEQQTTFVTEFAFKKGSEDLTPSSKQKLKEISQKALAKGKIEIIKVISWADQEYPSPTQKKLSDEQVELANNRNTEIKNYLQEINSKKDVKADVQLISMAKRPSAFNNLISSDDARIKKSLETSGIPTTASKSKTSAKSSRAIVLIKLEEKPR